MAVSANSVIRVKISVIKKLFVGSPLATAQASHERLSKASALAVFSSDALSSVAYATEEILLVLVLAGTAALVYSIPIGIAIALLIAVVVSSYRQTILAYPKGGGAYLVTKDNLGTLPGLVAGGALLIDYVLTVAVSVAAGVAAITSAFPMLYEYRLLIGVFFIAGIATVNLRGLRESSNVFALPTYLFVISFAGMLAYGFVRWIAGWETPPPPAAAVEMSQDLTIFLVLRAFASGCAALTGVEAVSDGVPAFRPPESRNARVVLAWLGIILITLFVGITFLARHFHVMPRVEETVVSQLARAIFGGGLLYYEIQVVTMLILVFAASHPPAVRSPRRPARLLQWHPDLGRAGRAAPAPLRRRNPRPHPALRGGRVRILHAFAGEHGAPLAHAPGDRLVVAVGAQRGRRGHHRARDVGHRGHQVQPRRLDDRAADPHPRRSLPDDPPALR